MLFIRVVEFQADGEELDLIIRALCESRRQALELEYLDSIDPEKARERAEEHVQKLLGEDA